MRVKNSLRLLLVCVALCLPAFAQTAGSIVGNVTDPASASVTNAKVELVNEKTGISAVALSSADGAFVFLGVVPGEYRLTVSSGGFKTSVHKNIVLQVNQTARVDVQLEVGSVSTSVDVSAQATIVQSETSSVGNVVDGNQIRAIPLNGRTTIYGLMALAPGVQGAGSNPAIAGAAYRGGTGQTVDGVSNDDAIGERLLGQLPSFDGIAEFKVISNAAPAEFGKSAQIVMATKGGGNEIHGSLFAFNRNAVMTAKAHSAQTLAKPAFNRNEYGGSVGGPVIKNKLFYFGSFEGLRLVQPTTTQLSMPTQAMRGGDFSSLLPTVVIKNPANGGKPFLNNIIPADRITAISKQFMAFMPIPNRPGTGAAGLGSNFVGNVSQFQPNDRYSIRADYQLSDKDTITGRYFWTNNGPYSTATGGQVPFNNWDGFGISTKNVAAQYTRILTPQLMNVVKFGLNDWTDYRVPQNHTLDPSTIVPGTPAPLEGLGGLPTIAMSGFSNVSDQPGSGDVNHQRMIADSLSWTRGKHSIKAGFEFARVDVVNRQNSAPYRGSFSFDGRYTGNSFADFLLGDLSTTSRSTSNFILDDVNYRMAAYIQDDWRIHPRLTLNIGLRYDFQSAWQKNNELALWDRATNKLIVASGTPNAAWNGVVPIDTTVKDVTGSNYMNLGKTNFAPRVGLAFRPLGKPTFVIRAAYGIFYNVMGEYDGAVDLRDLGLNPPFRASQTFLGSNNGIPNLTWADAWAGTGSSSTSSPPNLYAVDKNFRVGYTQQWNYTMEWEPINNTALRASYVGNKATHFVQATNINDPLPSSLAVQPRRPYQPWGSIFYYESNRNASFNQLQLGATRRYSAGLEFGVEYQFTRALGLPYDGALPTTWTNSSLDRGNSSQYVKNYVVMNYIYDLPFGRGKHFASGASTLVDKVIGGWQTAGIMTLASGNYLSVTFNSNLTGWPSGRANIVGDPFSNAQKNQYQWFNPASYAVPTAYTFGNSAPNSITGPGKFFWDMAVFKNTAITERIKFEFRVEAFNLLNHANLGNPGTNISVPAAVGIITGRDGSRVVQLGARLSF